jgi:hypothetical protein
VNDRPLDERARARRAWPVRVFRRGAEPGEDLSAVSTPEQRLAMVDELTRDAFALAGRPRADYARADSPVVLRRLGE